MKKFLILLLFLIPTLSLAQLGGGGGTVNLLPVRVFTGLSDTPHTYSGSANYFVTVNSAGTGLTFLSSSTLATTTFVTYSYASSTFPSFTYASSTYVSFGYGSSTYALFGSSTQWITNGSNIYFNTGNAAVGTTTPFSKFELNTNGLGVTFATTSGLSLINDTAAASTSQQVSPSIWFKSYGWGTTASTSQPVEWQMYELPVQAAIPTSNLIFASAINNGTFATKFTLASGGLLTTTGGLTIVGALSGATTGAFSGTITQTTAALATTTNTAGINLTNTTAATAATRTQTSPLVQLTGTAAATSTSRSNAMAFGQQPQMSSTSALIQTWPSFYLKNTTVDGVADASEWLRISGYNGNIGLSSSSPIAKFTIVGTSTAATFGADNSTVPLFEVASSTGTSLFRIKANGNIGIATTTGIDVFTVVGSTTISNLNAGGVVKSTTAGSLYNDNSSYALGSGATNTLAYWSNANTVASLTAGTAGNVLQASSTANGGATWVATSTLGISGGTGTPAGTEGAIQFNNGGTFGASTTLNYASSTNILSLIASSTTGPTFILRNSSLYASGNTNKISFNQDLGALNVGVASIGTVINTNYLGTSDADLTFAAGVQLAGYGGERMRLTGPGRLGIGTSTPKGLLDVGKAISATTSLTVGAILAMSSNLFTDTRSASGTTDTGNTWNSFAQQTLAATNASTTYTNLYGTYFAGAPTVSGSILSVGTSTALYIDNGTVSASTTKSYGLFVKAQSGATSNYAASFMGGNFGISTTTPGQLFTVAGGNSDFTGTGGAIARIGLTGTGYMALGFSDDITGGNYSISGAPGDTSLYINRKTGGDILFRENDNSSSQMVIKSSSGSVGINTTGPDSQLQVVGGGGRNLFNVSSTSGSVFKITVDNRVGIATTTPATALHVIGSTTISTLNAGGFVKSTLAGGLYNDTTDYASTSGVIANYVSFSYASSTFMTYSYASSTFASTSGLVAQYVPYTGGNANVNLGLHNLTVDTSTLFVDSVNHRVGIGTTSPDSLLTLSNNTGSLPAFGTAVLHMASADGSANEIVMDSFSAINALSFRRASGTAALPKALRTDDILGQVRAFGFGSSTYTATARANIRMNAAENWTDAAQGTYMSFFTTTAGGTSNLERFRIDDSGNIGIATSSPLARLEVYGKSGNNAIANFASSSNASALYIGANGRIGISTTSPDSRLTISENTGGLTAPSIGTVLHLASADLVSTRFNLDSFSAASIIDLRRASGTAAVPLALRADDIIGQVGFFGFGSSTYSSSVRASVAGSASQNWTDAAQGSYLTFGTTLNGAAIQSERMRIDNAGNVGISTTTAGTTLVVAGTSTSQAFLSSSLGLVTTPAYSFTNDSDTGMWSSGANSLDFSTAGTQRMRISTSGFMSIGTDAAGLADAVYGIDLYAINGNSAKNWIRISEQNSQGYTGFEAISSRNDANNAFEARNGLAFRRTDGTAIATNAALGAVAFGGQYDTDTTFQPTKILYPASIKGIAEGSFTAATAMQTGLAFFTGSTGDDIRGLNVTYGTERMRITNAGNVGIGNILPAGLLDVGATISSGTPALNTGLFMSQSAKVFTDNVTASSATNVGLIWNRFGQQQIAATNASTTYTNLFGTVFSGAPLANGGIFSIGTSTALYIGSAAVSASTTKSYGLFVNAQSNATKNYSGIFMGGNAGFGTTTPSATLNINGDIMFESASSTLITPSIGGAIVSGGCDSATSSIDTKLASSTVFLTTPMNDPGSTLGGTWVYSFISTVGVLTTRVCSNISVTPNTTTYVVKIIR